jgi:hypothetical protein
MKVHDDMQHVAGAWRHKLLRFGADRVSCTGAITAGSILILERPIVEESKDLQYDANVKDIAATLLVPHKKNWLPVRGGDIDTMSSQSLVHIAGVALRLRFIPFLNRSTAPSPNATLYLSPFPLGSTVLVLAKDIKVSQDVLVDWDHVEPLSPPESLQPLVALGGKMAAAIRNKQRWMTTGMQEQIDAAYTELGKLREQFSAMVTRELADESSSIGWKMCLRHYAEQVDIDTPGIDTPLFLPRPPLMTALHCEQAADVLATRQELGVSELETKLRDHLDDLKAFSLPHEDFEMD